MRRTGAILIAWAVGWMVYMVAMMMTVYDGILSLIFQPMIAMVISAFTVGIGLLVGLVFRLQPLHRLWHGNRLWAFGLSAVSVLVMCFGASLGFTETFKDPDTGREFSGLHSAVGLVCYFLLVFAVVNWPIHKVDSK